MTGEKIANQVNDQRTVRRNQRTSMRKALNLHNISLSIEFSRVLVLSVESALLFFTREIPKLFIVNTMMRATC